MKASLFFTHAIAWTLFFVVFFNIVPRMISYPDDLVSWGGYALLLISAYLFINFYIIKQFKKMRNWMKGKGMLLVLLAFVTVSMSSCSKVPAGNVGIKFYALGGSKGVDVEVLQPGKYWIGMNEELFLFPTFTQNYTWTASHAEGKPTDESFNFQDKDGLELNADIGITYHLDAKKCPLLFQRYKKGIDEITDVFLRNMVRDALVSNASKMEVSKIYGENREVLMTNITKAIRLQTDSIGIIIEKIYWIGRIKLPEICREAINAKINATTIAVQRENELRETEAKAKKQVAEAEGNAQSTLTNAKAQAEANRLLNASLTENLVKWKALDTWDGKMPAYWGGNALPFINMK